MTYTQRWFEITARENFGKFLEEFKGKPKLRFLEIGCFEGMATAWMLENILTDKTSGITVIDTFEGSFEHKEDGLQLDGMIDRFKENVGSGNVTIYQGLSNEILRKLPFEYYDFIYVDGSHHAKDALQDIVLSFDLLKHGGVMIFDDYAWNKFADNMNACMAMDAFLACYAGEYELLLKEYQIAIRKV